MGEGTHLNPIDRQTRVIKSGLICNFNGGGAEITPPSFLLKVEAKNLLTASYH